LVPLGAERVDLDRLEETLLLVRLHAHFHPDCQHRRVLLGPASRSSRRPTARTARSIGRPRGMVARSGRLRRTKAVDRPGDAQKGAGTSYVVPRVSMDESPDVASLTLRNRVAHMSASRSPSVAQKMPRLTSGKHCPPHDGGREMSTRVVQAVLVTPLLLAMLGGCVYRSREVQTSTPSPVVMAPAPPAAPAVVVPPAAPPVNSAVPSDRIV